MGVRWFSRSGSSRAQRAGRRRELSARSLVMARKIRNKAFLAITAMCLLLQNGCSLIGLGIGYSMDSSGPKEVPGSRLEALKPGSHLTLILADSSRVAGPFVGAQRDPEADYADRYSAYRNQDPGRDFLPEIGENIRLTLESGQESQGLFVGFDLAALYDESIIHYIWIEEHEQATAVPLNSVTAIEDSHGLYQAEQMEKIKILLLQNQVPILSSLVIESGYDRTYVPMEDVSEMTVPTKGGNARKLGLALGLAVDIYVLATTDWSFLDFFRPDFEIDFGGEQRTTYSY
jgi:hypothetical protein